MLGFLFNKVAGLKAYNFIKRRPRHKRFPGKFAKILRTPFLQNTSDGYFWKYLMNSLFIAYENDEWCHFVVRIGSPALISFYGMCFISFYFFLFFLFLLWILLLSGFEVRLSIPKIKQWSCS